MSHAETPPSPDLGALKPRVKVWSEAEGGFSFGFGLIAILQNVDRAGSIKHAAGRPGTGLPPVWGRIKAAEHASERRWSRPRSAARAPSGED